MDEAIGEKEPAGVRDDKPKSVLDRFKVKTKKIK
jgi:hypothetical protein